MTSNDLKCTECGQDLGDAADFCPQCGHQLSALPASGEGGEGEIYLTLLTANVLRLRREWEQAEDKCSEALRLDPENASAYSVMGDIARDQGKLRDAMEWYKWALDRNPESTSDRKKLEALIDREFSGQPEGATRKGLDAVRRAVSTARAEIRSARPPAALTLLVGAVLLAIFLIAVFTVVVGQRGEPGPNSPTSEVSSGAFVAPNGEASSAPAAEPTQPPPAAIGSALAAELAEREPELLGVLQARVPRADPNCTVLAAEIDPRDASVTVRVSMPRLWSSASMRDSISRGMAAAASEAVAWDDRVSRVTVRCDIRDSSRPDWVGAVAEGTRSQVANLGQGTVEDLQSALSSVWWASELMD